MLSPGNTKKFICGYCKIEAEHYIDGSIESWKIWCPGCGAPLASKASSR